MLYTGFVQLTKVFEDTELVLNSQLFVDYRKFYSYKVFK